MQKELGRLGIIILRKMNIALALAKPSGGLSVVERI
jgi:hypothetical protein